MGYPTDRPPYFAQKVIRKMVKTCAASEMGQTAFMLVAIVATTEDAAGYTRPVTFFNDALLPLIGVRKWDTLDRARKTAVDAGWLEYEAPASGKRTPGRYWVKIPSHLEGLNDSPVDEEATKAYPINGDALGKAYPVNGDDTRKAYTQNGYASGKASPMNGEGMGDAMGEPSTYTYTKKEREGSSLSDSGKKKPAKAKGEPRKLKFGNDDWKTAEWMRGLVHEFNPEARNPDLGKWADEIRKMREIEKRTDERIREVFQWAMDHTQFWQGKVTTPKKLREKFDTLTGQMKTANRKADSEKPRMANEDELASAGYTRR